MTRNYFSEKSLFYRKIKSLAIKQNKKPKVSWQYSSLDDMKEEFIRLSPNQEKAKTIVKQIDSRDKLRQSKSKSNSFEDLQSTFLNKPDVHIYLVDYQYEWRSQTKPTWMAAHGQFKTRLSDPTVSGLLDKAQRAAENHVQERSRDGYDQVEIRDVQISTYNKVKDVRSLVNVPFYRYILSYPNLSLDEDNINDNFISCGFKMLLEQYPQKSQSLEHLEQFFGRKQDQGMTPNNLLEFCDHHDLSCYVVDLNGNSIVQRSRSDSKNSRKDREQQALICTIASGHCYVIKDENIREKIIKSVLYRHVNVQGSNLLEFQNESKITNQCVFVEQFPEQIEPNTNYYINTEKLNKEYIDYLDESKAYNAKWVQDDVKSIYIGNSQLHASPDYPLIRDTCSAFNIPFRNQSMSKLCRELFDEKKKNWQESVFSPEVEELFQTDLVNASAFYMTFDDNKFHESKAVEYKLEHYEKDGYKISGLDIKRLYTSVARNGGFFYLDVSSTIEDYDNSKITHGFYFVDKKSYWPLKGKGFYDYQLVDFCLEKGIIEKTDIKYMLKGIACGDIDKCLRSFIDFVYAQNCQDKIKKNLINSLIGSFGIKKKEIQKQDILTTSQDEAYYYFWKFNGQALIRKIYTPEDKLIYRVTAFEDVIRMSNNLPIRMQIVHRANISAYKLWEHVKNSKAGRHTYIPIAIKTDCVYYAHRKKDGKLKEVNPDQFGGYRIENNVPDKFHRIVPEIRNQSFNKTILEWNTLEASSTEYFDCQKVLEYNRVLVKGFAGAAKSTIINKLKEDLKDDFVYCAYTHTAANNIQGQTIHHLFGINFMTGELCAKKFKNLIKNKKGIIIDECFMVTMDIYRILVKLPKEFKIYLFGDSRQIKPIEENEFDYENSELLKQLVEGNQIILRKQCRADAEFANKCVKAFDEDKWDEFIAVRADIESVNTQLNIVKTNLCRVMINDFMINKMVSRHTESSIPKNQSIPLSSESGIQKFSSTRFSTPTPIKLNKGEFSYIYRGLPVIANETVRGVREFEIGTPNDIFNGQQFTISFIVKNAVCLTKRNLTGKFDPKTIWISYDFLARNFSPAYAITVNKLQGATLSIPHAIWEWQSMDKHARYTAVTRTTKKELLSIYKFSVPIEKTFNLITGKRAYLYEITDGKKRYVGSTTRSIETRWEEHLQAYETENWRVYKYMRKVGVEHFKIKKLFEFDYASLSHVRKAERHQIELLQPQLNERDPETNRPIASS
jgi:hypothetical protein